MAKGRVDTEAVINLVINGKQALASQRELEVAQRRLNAEFKNMKSTDPGYAKQKADLILLNRALEEYRKEMKGINTEADDLKRNWSDVVAIAGGNLLAQGIETAVSALSNFVSGAQQAYSESEQGQASLQATLKSTGGIAGRTKGQLDELAGSLMRLTGVDDDVITKSEGLLLTFTNVRGEIFDQTIPAIVDMTAKLNDGNVSMETIQATTMQVGKALNDPIKGMTALRKVGVSFTEDQVKTVKSLVATNDVAGAQKLILNELTTEFGGVAKAMSDTESGGMQKMQTRLGNIQEALGGFIVKSKASMSQVFAPLVTWLERATATKLSDTLDRDRASLAANMVQLQASNTTHETRVSIIKTLKEQYPAYLGQIDAEKVSNGKLLPVLNEVNKALVMRIAFQKKNEALTNSIEDEADAFLKMDKAGTQLSQTMAVIIERARDKGLNIVLPKDITDIEQAEFLINSLNKAKKDGTGLNIKQSVQDIGIAQTNLMQLKRAYAEAGEERNKLLNAQTSFASKYKLNSKGETEKMAQNNIAPVVIPANASGYKDPASEKAKQAAQKLAEEIEAISEEIYQNSLEKNDKEIEAVRVKYQKLEEQAKGNKAALTEIANLEGQEMLQLYAKFEKENLDAAKKAGEELAKTKADSAEKAKNKADAVARIGESGLTGAKLELYQADQHYKDLLALADKFGLDATDIRKKWAAARSAILDEEVKKEKEKEAEKHKEIKDTAIGSAQDVATAVFDIAANNRRAESDANLSKIDEERQKELSNKNLTEEQKEKINKKYDAKVRAEKLRAWKADQKAAITQAIISGALAVVKALPNLFLAGAAGIAAAAQIAVIATTKPPEFAGGVRNFEGGPAVIGEAGMELVEEEGRWWLTKKPQLTNLSPGTDVYNAGDTSDILSRTLGEQLYPPVQYSVANEAAREAELSYRSGYSGGSSSSISPAPVQPNPAPIVNLNNSAVEKKLDQVIDAISKGLIFNYSKFEDFKAEVDATREDQSA
ncbi:hypothetical protein [Pedobacter ginsengisoli]|uniref:hypothetical protein n=1 Tax=Pedobacter ginsengisoli TaxID=363852 RepID=UPI00254CD501|nr:hypothetical protein [Pedobacter ginsengisoli]